MNALTVYCSSSTYLDPDFHAPALEVGRELARRHITLVYGGGSVGLMGEVARACHDGGGRIVGVITQRLYDLERGYDDCDEMIITRTMRERKLEMEHRGEGFIILPGGVGTYEEFFEILTGRYLGEHNKPIGIVNSHGYYNPMIAMIAHGIEHKFIKPAVWELLHVDTDPAKVIDRVINDECNSLNEQRFIPMGKK